MRGIFDKDARAFSGSRPRSMPLFEYVNRSDREELKTIRSEWDSFFCEYPDGHKKDLFARFRSKNNREHYSAMFELLLYMTFKRLSFRIKIHPETDSPKNANPDFLIFNQYCKGFYLEALCLFGDEVETDDQKRKDIFLDTVGKMVSEKYKLMVEFDGETFDNVRANALKKEIESWLNDLDYQTVEQCYENGGIRGVPSLQLSSGGTNITISAIPKKHEDGPIISFVHPHPMAVRSTTHEILRKGLLQKAKKYGRLDRPLILAANVFDFFFDNDDMFDALLGDRVVYFSKSDSDMPTSSEYLPPRKNNGLWTSLDEPTYTRVHACIFFRGIDVASFKSANPLIVINPYVNHDKILSKFRYFDIFEPDPQKGEFTFKQGMPIDRLFTGGK